MNIVYCDAKLKEDINDAQLQKPFERMIGRLRDRDQEGISRQAIGKGLLWSHDKYVCAIAIGSNHYFCLDVFKPDALPGVRILCAFNLFTPEDALAGQVDKHVENTCNRADRRQAIPDQTLIDYAAKYCVRNDDNDGQALQNKPLPMKYSGWVSAVQIDTALEKSLLGMVVRETERWGETFRGRFSGNELARALYSMLGKVFFMRDTESLDGRNPCCKPVGNHAEGQSRYYLLHLDAWRFLCRFRGGAECDSDLTLVDMWNEESISVEDRILEFEKEYERRSLHRPMRFYPGNLFYGGDGENQNSRKSRAFEKWLELEKREMPTTFEFSEEESEIIHNQGQQRTLPLFINGSAGSGKSTILYYLFANYWLLFWADQQKDPEQRRFEGRPLFLTLSARLREHARETVGDIIWFDAENSDLSEKQIKEELKPCFRTFDEILRQILGDDMSRQFPEKDEIQFELFKDLLLGKGDMLSPELSRYRFQDSRQAKYTPELCWHIIRCYIKGGPGEEFSDEDSFRRFIQSRRQDKDIFVDEESCLYVWEHVWWPWYRKLTSGSDASPLWDRQDMARAALRRLQVPGQELPEGLNDIVSVCVDEAQDYTGVEMSIVQKLSLLLRYQLPKDQCSELPFAFAGDPLQTLNPSGFRWADLKRSVLENMLRPSGASHELCERQLAKNYRSPYEIVRLANMVQLSRKMLFDDAIVPQDPDKGYPGDIFYVKNLDEKRTLEADEVKNLKSSVILLPCSPGKEDDFIGQWPLLQDIQAKCKEDVEILSVLEAKGLDISRVVLFAFGDSLFGGEKEAFPEDTDGRNRDISLSYSLNKVYVGVTRAMEQLQILDTRQGAARLWEHVGFENLRNKYLKALEGEGRREVWERLLPKKDIDALNDSGIGFGKNDMSEAELLEEAHRWFTNAYFQGNVKQMQAAAHRFGRLGKKEERLACEGFAETFAKRMDKAAEFFEKALNADMPKVRLGTTTVDLSERFLSCLWRVAADADRENCCWAKLCKFVGTKPDQRFVAQVMGGDIDGMDLVELAVERLEEKEVSGHVKGAQWEKCLARLTDCVVKLDLLGGKHGKQDCEFDHTKLEELADLLSQHAVGVQPCCATAILTIYVYLARQASSESRSRFFRDRAHDLIVECDVPGMEEVCDWVEAHYGSCENYVRRCQNIGDTELCVKRWRHDESPDKGRRAAEGLSESAKRFLLESLFNQAKKSRNDDSLAQTLRREAVDVAFSMKFLAPVLNHLAEVRNLLDLARLEECLQIQMSGSLPDWGSCTRFLEEEILPRCRTNEDVNKLLDNLARSENLLSGGARQLESALVEFLKRRETAAFWPKTGEDVERAAGFMACTGLNEPIARLSDYLLTSPLFNGMTNIREVALELYLFARRRYSDDPKTRNPVAIKQKARDFLVENGYLADEEGNLTGGIFNDYWDAARNRGYKVLPPYSRKEDGAAANASSKGDFESCVEGAKSAWDEDNGNYKHEMPGFRFVETLTRVTVIPQDPKLEKAVVLKDDWSNQSGNLRDAGFIVGVTYCVVPEGLVLKAPAWERQVFFRFKKS